MRLALLVIVSVLLALAEAARAHDPGLSSAHLTRGVDRLETRMEFHDADLEGLDLVSLAPNALRLEGDAGPIEPISVEVAPTRERHTGIHLVHPLEAESESTATLAMIERLSFGHKTYLRVQRPDGSPLIERILSREAPSADLPRAGGGGDGVRAPWQFFALGIEHILLGFDHLLFLFVVLLGCTGLGAAIRVATVFSVAHSLTLAAATLGWLRLPPDLVEPLIAASIVYVAGLLVLSGGHSRERVAATFGFGLVHGLGFAGVLGALGVGSAAGGVVLPLLSFNLGVEVGQLGIACLVLPVLLSLRRAPVFGRLAVPVCAGIAGVVGMIWLAERTLVA